MGLFHLEAISSSVSIFATFVVLSAISMILEDFSGWTIEFVTLILTNGDDRSNDFNLESDEISVSFRKLLYSSCITVLILLIVQILSYHHGSILGARECE